MSPRSSYSKQSEKSKKPTFNWRFRPPSRAKTLKALELKSNRKNAAKRVSNLARNDALFSKLMAHFGPLAQPEHEKDWLVTYNELEQSCDQFLKESPIDQLKENGLIIYYIQMGRFDQTSLRFSDLLDYAKAFFGPDRVKQMTGHIQIDIDFERKTARAQYNNNHSANLKARFSNATKLQIQAQSFHKLLRKIRPNDACCLIAFTDYDLYIEDGDLFVAGLCDGQMRVGGFSCFRYEPSLRFSEFNWFDTRWVKKQSNNDLLMRSVKLLAHETCHLLGIDHCVYFDCCMNGSGHLAEDFKQSMFLCPIDLKKLWMVFEFDVSARYTDLFNFFRKHKCRQQTAKLKTLIKHAQTNK